MEREELRQDGLQARKCGAEADGQAKKCFLGRYRDNEEEIRRLQKEILDWEALEQSMSVTKREDGERRRVAVERIKALRVRLVEQVIERVRLRERIGEAINTVSEERLQRLLRYRYIEGWTWQRVAGEMHYSWRQITNLHDKALERVRLS